MTPDLHDGDVLRSKRGLVKSRARSIERGDWKRPTMELQRTELRVSLGFFAGAGRLGNGLVRFKMKWVSVRA